MKIEKLEPSKHKQGRWLVWLEDASIVRVGEGDVVSLGLYAGKELTDEEGEALAAAGGKSKLMERAVELLSLRLMSRKASRQAVRPAPAEKGEVSLRQAGRRAGPRGVAGADESRPRAGGGSSRPPD